MALLLYLACSFAAASTILQVDIDYLLENAELVFQGEVVASEAKEVAASDAVHTSVFFRVDEVIAGSYAAPTLVLEFAGGIAGGKGMRVAGLVQPQAGERGIYFVESIAGGLANPLLGWSQGHFVLQRDSAGRERVMSNRLQPVLGLEAQPQARNRFAPFSEGVARGVQTGRAGESANSAMSITGFKAALREKLQK